MKRIKEITIVIEVCFLILGICIVALVVQSNTKEMSSDSEEYRSLIASADYVVQSLGYETAINEETVDLTGVSLSFYINKEDDEKGTIDVIVSNSSWRLEITYPVKLDGDKVKETGIDYKIIESSKYVGNKIAIIILLLIECLCIIAKNIINVFVKIKH